MNRCRLVLKLSWLAITLFVLLMGVGTCANSTTCQLAANDIQPLLLLLSFPGGLLFFFFAEPLIDFYPALDYALVSLGLIAIGYAQWFVVLPRLFGKHAITTLGLSSTIEKKQSVPISANPHTNSQLQPPPAHETPIQSFDSAGRTPLERAIYDDQEHLSRAGVFERM